MGVVEDDMLIPADKFIDSYANVPHSKFRRYNVMTETSSVSDNKGFCV